MTTEEGNEVGKGSKPADQMAGNAVTVERRREVFEGSSRYRTRGEDGIRMRIYRLERKQGKRSARRYVIERAVDA